MILCAVSAPNHLDFIVAPLVRLLPGTQVIYGGSRRPWSPRLNDVHASHITEYCGVPRRFWSRPAWLDMACTFALDYHRPEGVVITSARYHLEQSMLRVCKGRVPVIAYLSTYVMEVRMNDSPVLGGAKPRMQYYDVGDRIAVMGDHLRDQLIAHGVRPERILVLGAPWLRPR